MSNSIIPHSIEGTTFFQSSEDTSIGGIAIPKGFVNLTQLCKAGGKKLNDYTRLKRSNTYLEALSLDTGIPVSRLIIEIKGTPGGDASLQGTWGHNLVAVSVAAWISPEFEVQANKVIWAVINNDFTPLTEEAAIAQLKLKEQWEKIRNASKEAFWNLGDAIKAYIEAHPERSDKFRAFVFSNCQDCLNRGLFGKDASTIRDELKVKDLVRDHYGHTALKRIELIQSLASASILHRDIEPLEAVKFALAMFSFEVMDYQE